jgi:hypothetical protein
MNTTEKTTTTKIIDRELTEVIGQRTRYGDWRQLPDR